MTIHRISQSFDVLYLDSGFCFTAHNLLVNSSYIFSVIFPQSLVDSLGLEMFLKIFFHLTLVNLTLGCLVLRFTPENTNQDSSNNGPIQFSPFMFSSARPRYVTTQSSTSMSTATTTSTSATTSTAAQQTSSTTRTTRKKCTCGKLNKRALKPKPYIVGGEPTPPNLYPWMVFIENVNGSLLCGGSLISKRYPL